MQRNLSPRFKTKYLGPGKADIFINLLLSCTSCMAPAHTARHGFSDTHLGQSNTGFAGSFPRGLPGYGRVIGRGDRVASLPRSYRSCGTRTSSLPENLDTTKTSGTVCCCLTTLRRVTLFHSVYGSAKGYFTSLDLDSRDRAERLAKPILLCRKPSKKLLPMDERPHYPALVRGRSPFPAIQQPDKVVGTQGSTTARALAFSPQQSGLLWSAQFEKWISSHQGGAHFQCRDLWRVCPLPSLIYSRKTIPHPGQCEIAQSASLERFLLSKSGPGSTYLPTALFPRTQSSGTSLEDHSPAGNPQPQFPNGPKTQNRFSISFYEMGAAKHHN